VLVVRKFAKEATRRGNLHSSRPPAPTAANKVFQEYQIQQIAQTSYNDGQRGQMGNSDSNDGPIHIQHALGEVANDTALDDTPVICEFFDLQNASLDPENVQSFMEESQFVSATTCVTLRSATAQDLTPVSPTVVSSAMGTGVIPPAQLQPLSIQPLVRLSVMTETSL
jgi:hypothetical protein